MADLAADRAVLEQFAAIDWELVCDLIDAAPELRESLQAPVIASEMSSGAPPPYQNMIVQALVELRQELTALDPTRSGDRRLGRDLLKRLFRILTLVLVATLLGAPLGAAAAGEGILPEMIKVAIGTLIVACATEVIAVRGELAAEPYAVAQREHQALLSALGQYNDKIGQLDEADRHRVVVAQIGVLGQVCAARCAALDVRHREQVGYLAALDAVSHAVVTRSVIKPGRLLVCAPPPAPTA